MINKTFINFFLLLLSLSAGEVMAIDHSQWQKINESGVIKCGALTSFSPFSWKVDGPSQYEGTSINFCRAIASDLGKSMGKKIDVKYVDTSWSTVVLDIQSGRIDLFVGLNTSEERRKALALSGPAYELPDCIVTAKNIKQGDTWESLNQPDFSIATLSGSNSEKTFKQWLPRANILAFKQQSEAILATQSGRVQGYGVGLVACIQVSQTNPQVFSRFVVPKPYHSTPSMAATRIDSDGKLAKWVQQWTDQARNEKKIKALMFDGWKKSGMDMSALPDDLKI